MKFISTLLGLVAMPVIQVTLAHPEGSLGGLTVRSESVSGYAISEMQYSGTLGGKDVQFNGTVESIYAQIKDKDASFKIPTVSTRDLELEARNKDGLLCCPIRGQNWGPADRQSILNGIGYLDSLNGRCGVNSYSCARISCSYNSAIWLCNDNSYFINPSCTYLASYAVDIIDNCVEVCGQEFDSDRYNIIVRGDNC